MSIVKIALVTEGAHGLGFEIVKKLCLSFPGDVYFTSSNTDEGNTAVKNLEELGLRAKFVYLDITKHDSVMVLMKRLRYTEGGLDLLINNADVKFDKPYDKPLPCIAFKMLGVNYEGTKEFTNEMFYIMRRGSKVLNISSESGYLSNIPSMEIREKLSNPELTSSALDSFLEKYKESVSRGSCIEDGWGDDPYVVSKAFLTALTSVQQRHVDSLERCVSVNCIDAGYSVLDTEQVKTDEEKAESIVALALNIPSAAKGSIIT